MPRHVQSASRSPTLPERFSSALRLIADFSVLGQELRGEAVYRHPRLNAVLDPANCVRLELVPGDIRDRAVKLDPGLGVGRELSGEDQEYQLVLLLRAVLFEFTPPTITSSTEASGFSTEKSDASTVSGSNDSSKTTMMLALSGFVVLPSQVKPVLSCSSSIVGDLVSIVTSAVASSLLPATSVATTFIVNSVPWLLSRGPEVASICCDEASTS